MYEAIQTSVKANKIVLIHWVPLRMSSVGSTISTRLQQADSFASKLLTAILKISVIISTLLQLTVFFTVFFSF